jgi:hypothetical protein
VDNALFEPVLLYTICLPRQARDKHQETLAAKAFSMQGIAGCTPATGGANNAAFAPFHTRNDHFTKPGSGQT